MTKTIILSVLWFAGLYLIWAVPPAPALAEELRSVGC